MKQDWDASLHIPCRYPFLQCRQPQETEAGVSEMSRQMCVARREAPSCKKRKQDFMVWTKKGSWKYRHGGASLTDKVIYRSSC